MQAAPCSRLGERREPERQAACKEVRGSEQAAPPRPGPGAAIALRLGAYSRSSCPSVPAGGCALPPLPADFAKGEEIHPREAICL